MTHAVHVKPRVVFGDDCEECVGRATSGLEGLMKLDHSNLVKLARLALTAEEIGGTPLGASYADMKAVDTLRRASWVLWVSGLSMDNIADLRKHYGGLPIT